jgi:hypothetical protein
MVCADVTAGWDRMNSLLDSEWDALKTRDVNTLIKLAGTKNRLAGQIENSEKRLSQMIDMLLEACGLDSEERNRWRLRRGLLCSEDLRRLNDWKWQRDASRDRAVAVNRRIHRWVTEQIDTTHTLVSVIAGRKEPDSYTYTSKGVKSRPERGYGVPLYTPSSSSTNRASGISLYRGIQGDEGR